MRLRRNSVAVPGYSGAHAPLLPSARTALVALLAASPMQSQLPRPADAPPPRLPGFSLKDQFDRPHASTSLGGAPVIVVVTSRAGSKAIAGWMRQLHVAAQGSTVQVLPVGDMKGAPRFVRGFIRSTLPKDARQWLALDWDGQLAAPVRGERGELVAAAYDADGELRAWESLPLSGVDAHVASRLVQRARGS